jgi:muramoyltetrapeptide carboxypeptidase
MCWRPGTATGPLLGGLLSRLIRLQATPFALPPQLFRGAILFWEDLRRPLQAVWNDLHILRTSGVLDSIAGMIIGVLQEVAAVDAGADPPTLREAVLDVVGDREIPILAGVDFGHITPNLPLPIGVTATLDATGRAITLDEPMVQAPDTGDR